MYFHRKMQDSHFYLTNAQSLSPAAPGSVPEPAGVNWAKALQDRRVSPAPEALCIFMTLAGMRTGATAGLPGGQATARAGVDLP